MNIIEHYKTGSTDRELAMDTLNMLSEQGCRAYTAEIEGRAGQCVYFDPCTGNKCAVGVLLPDAKVATGIFSNVTNLVSELRCRVVVDGEEIANLDDLIEALDYYEETLIGLQQFHDSSERRGRVYGLLPEEFVEQVRYTLFKDVGEY